MTEATENTTDNEDSTDEPVVDELTLLKKQADTMNLVYHPNIGVDKLRAKIAEELNGETKEEAKSTKKDEERELSPQEVLNHKRRKIKMEQLKLVRCRITNMNPAKKELHGEIFTVGNSLIGTVKKFVPYGEVTDEGYHIPLIIYNQLKGRKFLQVKSRKDPRNKGQFIIEQRQMSEFAIEVLDPLTKEELAELAHTQAASGGVS